MNQQQPAIDVEPPKKRGRPKKKNSNKKESPTATVSNVKQILKKHEKIDKENVRQSKRNKPKVYFLNLYPSMTKQRIIYF